MVISLVAYVLVLLPVGYLLVLAVAAIRAPERPVLAGRQPTARMAIAIPAHNEAAVIAATVRCLQGLDYPPERFAIYVVADHCTDDTAELARQAGAIVHERRDGLRLGKGAALSFLFGQILAHGYDAVVVFDADTRVEHDFLRVMDVRLAEGARVIQGQHVIRNPESGWFPALTWAMFLIDNRFQNLGRCNLGWSAKHMGDSICFRADVLRSLGWGEGLTEDYQLRQRLLLAGIPITYEPWAKGYGEAPRTWAQARVQRARWLRGTRQSSAEFGRQLWREALRRRDLGLLDGALQASLPSYSTLTLVCVLALSAQLGLDQLDWLATPGELLAAWSGACAALFAYPLFGLALEGAPARAYLVILTGPLFVIWRTIMAMAARLSRKPAVWVRTAHGDPQ